MTRDWGFTLVEMLVALTIFAMIAAAGVTLLSVGVRTQAAAAAKLDDVAATRRMAALLANDFAQLVPRPSRDAAGAPIAAFAGTEASDRGRPLMAYVRGGRDMPEGTAQSSLQRVDLVFDGTRLERRSHAATDGGDATTSFVLADGVTALAVRYRDARGAWTSRWADPSPTALPAAVELTITRRAQAPVTLAFLAGTGA